MPVSLLLALLLAVPAVKDPAAQPANVAAEQRAGVSAERPELPELRTITVITIDRAVARLDLRQERITYVAGHPESPLPGLLPAYAAEITVEDRARELTPTIEEYRTLPFTGIGGRQGPAYDPWTGIPWWF